MIRVRKGAFGSGTASEHGLVDCLVKHFGNDKVRNISRRATNGIGTLKVFWEGSIVANVWRSELVQNADVKMSFGAHMNYRRHVLRNLHFLQLMNGGVEPLNKLRSLGGTDPNVLKYVPEAHFEQQRIASPSKCERWSFNAAALEDDRTWIGHEDSEKIF